jgi:transposase
MRTELAIGETVTELTRNLSAAGSQMLVLGITDIAHAGSAYRSLLAAQPGWPVLIVYRPAETRAAPELVASGSAA